MGKEFHQKVKLGTVLSVIFSCQLFSTSTVIYVIGSQLLSTPTLKELNPLLFFWSFCSFAGGTQWLHRKCEDKNPRQGGYGPFMDLFLGLVIRIFLPRTLCINTNFIHSIQWKGEIPEVIPTCIWGHPPECHWSRVYFDEGGKPEYPEKNPRSQIEIDWNSAHIWPPGQSWTRVVRDSLMKDPALKLGAQ